MLANIAIVLTLVLIIQVVSIKKHLHHKLQTDREGGGGKAGVFYKQTAPLQQIKL